MKKLYLIAAMAVATLAANAQEKLTLSTYNGTNVSAFDGKVCSVTTNRYVFTGWNTLSLPFAMTEEELNEAFGSDCRLERLVGAERVGNTICIDFQDCKAQGLQANTPYILYYTGAPGTKRIAKEALVSDAQSALRFDVKGGSETVTMVGTRSHIDGVGLYGVLARDNAEAQFVKVAQGLSGFYATRCYIQISGADDVQLLTRHNVAGAATSIQSVADADEVVDVYNTAGMRVASQIRASEVGNLQSGIYVVKGQKILVR